MEPTDSVRILMAADCREPDTGEPKFASSMDCATDVYDKAGVSGGFFKGYLVTLSNVACRTLAYFVAAAVAQRACSVLDMVLCVEAGETGPGKRPLTLNQRLVPSWLMSDGLYSHLKSFFVGTAAGLSQGVTSVPFDNVRRRLLVNMGIGSSNSVIFGSPGSALKLNSSLSSSSPFSEINKVMTDMLPDSICQSVVVSGTRQCVERMVREGGWGGLMRNANGVATTCFITNALQHYATWETAKVLEDVLVQLEEEPQGLFQRRGVALSVVESSIIGDDDSDSDAAGCGNDVCVLHKGSRSNVVWLGLPSPPMIGVTVKHVDDRNVGGTVTLSNDSQFQNPVNMDALAPIVQVFELLCSCGLLEGKKKVIMRRRLDAISKPFGILDDEEAEQD